MGTNDPEPQASLTPFVRISLYFIPKSFIENKFGLARPRPELRPAERMGTNERTEELHFLSCVPAQLDTTKNDVGHINTILLLLETHLPHPKSSYPTQMRSHMNSSLPLLESLAFSLLESLTYVEKNNHIHKSGHSNWQGNPSLVLVRKTAAAV